MLTILRQQLYKILPILSLVTACHWGGPQNTEEIIEKSKQSVPVWIQSKPQAWSSLDDSLQYVYRKDEPEDIMQGLKNVSDQALHSAQTLFVQDQILAWEAKARAHQVKVDKPTIDSYVQEGLAAAWSSSAEVEDIYFEKVRSLTTGDEGYRIYVLVVIPGDGIKTVDQEIKNRFRNSKQQEVRKLSKL